MKGGWSSCWIRCSKVRRPNRLPPIARTRLATRKEGKSSLIVAPTHAECRAIADVVREQQSAKNGAVVHVESREKALLWFEDWAGRREILRKTSHHPVIRFQEAWLLPSGRRGTKGQLLKVPNYALTGEEEELTR